MTYNVHGDEQGRDRPWELDALPLLIPAAEWSALAAGLDAASQVAEHDSGGCLRPANAAGLRRPAVGVRLHAHPNSLRPCHRVRVPRDTYLHLYAVHLARSADDGRWLVLADRTQTPSGAGYAVENRIVISRMLPNKFQDCRVQLLASFFISVRETLRGLAAHHRDNPRIVLMSPGPTSATYFEDAYLARYLGYTLVEGGDLTVRDNRVYLKTLGGLIQSDVILRRVADEDCDPLELPGESGVPGLLQVRGSTNAIVANALRSGLLGCSPALLGFLPQLARRLLGEELLIPSVATWWCGRPADLAYVLQNLDQLAIKPAFGGVTAQATLVSRLSAAERDKLVAKIKARPRDFVGQQWVSRSTCAAAGDERRWRATVARRAADISRRHEGFLRSHARRIDAGLGLWRPLGRFDVGRRREQRRVGAFRGAGGGSEPLASGGNAGSSAAKRKRFAQPRGRQSVLAWPRRGTGGRRHSAVAERRSAAHERNRAK